MSPEGKESFAEATKPVNHASTTRIPVCSHVYSYGLDMCTGVYVYMWIDMCIDMCTGMGLEMCTDMRMNVCTDMGLQGAQT